ncbi:MAG: AraC family transcriptional regulator [Cyanobacteria bacterium P01_F01_bin.116]
MPKILTRENINELFSQSSFTRQDATGDIEFTWPADIAQGGNRIVQVRSGLQVFYETLTPESDLRLQANYLPSDPFGLIFILSGDSEVSVTRARQPLTFLPKGDINVLGYGGTEKGTINYLSGQTAQIVQIVVEPWLMGEFVQRNPINLPLPMREILQGDRSRAYVHIGETNPAMQMALHQLWHCPYQGLTRLMYLEGKALELLALKLFQLSEDNSKQLPKSLKPQDVERIHHAKDLLLSDIENPPSLIALARAVGLNDYKLKQGFHHVFDTTVFGYLHNHRMEKARQLLQTTDLSVSEVAYAVGFSNRSYFAAAFRRKFNINPKAYLQQSQRERKNP